MPRSSVTLPVAVSRLHYPEPDLIEGLTRLRTWSLDDVACIEEASSDPRIPEGTTVPAVYNAVAGREFIERHWSRLDDNAGVSLAAVLAKQTRRSA